MKSRTVSVAVAAPPEQVYAFAAQPRNLPLWARGFARSVRQSDEGWVVETDAGPVGIRFVPDNAFGILDHAVSLPGGETVLNPMRVIPSGSGSEIQFTVFQREGVDDAAFARDVQLVADDLETLGRLLEAPPAPQRAIGAVSLLVRDYDEAIAWFTRALGFSLVEDIDLGQGKRWVVVAPQGGARLLLAQASKPDELAALGRQAGGRVFLFLHTDDFARDHARMQAEGVHFREAPRHEAYGTVAVFADLCGNPWDLIGPPLAAG